jgi:hypothetical protein
MIDLSGVTHHPAIEEIVEVICNKVQNTDRGFFRAEVAYFLAKVASCMRATVVTENRGELPVNIYAIALANSGYGKGHSVNIMEEDLLGGFHRRFLDDTMPVISEKNFWPLANDRALRNNTNPQDEKDKLEAMYNRQGSYPFTFAEGTPEGLKQIVYKLRLGGIGSINLQMDEVGSNLEKGMELLNVGLELYDQGLVKGKLTKSTTDNQRNEDISGKTPMNMLLFGTPTKLFDGSSTESQFYSLLDTGYARRSLFGYGEQNRKAFHSMTPEEIYDREIAPDNSALVQKWATHFHQLADPSMFGWRMKVERQVAIQLQAYKMACELAAEKMPEIGHEIQKAEISHRYNKALKLAGAFAFTDVSNEVEMEHLMQAILLVEESGEAFKKILKREKAHVKLGKFIAGKGEPLTHPDLSEELPFYKGTLAFRTDLMNYAIAWGYKNNVIIKKTFVDGIEMFQGETLEQTDLDKTVISYSGHWAYNYEAETAPFYELHNLTQAEQEDGTPMHWANHAFKGGHRAEENVIPGFNLIVLDVDEGVSLATVHELMKDYVFLTYTTKRHQTEGHGDRFRLILPTNYRLELDGPEYKEFMDGVMSWLPFKVDPSCNQRAKKWETYSAGSYHYNQSDELHLFDVLPFIPKTRKNEEFRKDSKKLASLDNLERWFAQRIGGEGSGRNNQMIKFTLALVDGGMDFPEVAARVHAFNKKLEEPMTEEEIDSTVLVTAAKRFQKLAAD